MIVLFTGDTAPAIEDTIAVDGDPQVLTGATVTFFARLATSTDVLIETEAEIVDEDEGTVRYPPELNDLDPDFYIAWWLVEFSDDTVQSTPEFLFELRGHGPLVGDLTTLSAVRDLLQKEDDDVYQDSTIMRLIRPASRAIIARMKAELAPPAEDATRRFRVRPHMRTRERSYLVELAPAPCDLRTATEVLLHPESGSPVVLEEGVDYVLDHEVAGYGVFRALKLSADVNVCSDLHSRFGFAQLDITGDWGFETVPAEVDYWCAMQVWTWMRRDIQSFSSTYSISEERLERPEALASAVVNGLKDLNLGRARFA